MNGQHCRRLGAANDSYKNAQKHRLRVVKYLVGWCNTAAARHHERTCIDMDVIVVQAALPHIFDQQVFRKGLILDIGVCIMEEK